MTTDRLEIRNLRRSFGGRAVVNDVSLSIKPGQVTCLLGPSGCGKSTTLRMIAGVEKQESGAIFVDGQPISDGDTHLPPEQRNIGLMFQDFSLFPHLSVANNVGFALRGNKKERRTRIEELLTRVDLLRFIDSYPHELSGGEQQRVALARALAPRPRIMLMDEPFSGLDNRLRDGIRDETLAILKEQDTAVLLVTHEPDEAMRMADEIALMRAGRIVQQGAPYSVYTNPTDKATLLFFSDANVVPATVKGALVDTPYGQFAADGFADGSDVDVVFRPQHVRIDFDRAGAGPAPTQSNGSPASAKVVRARFMGRESLVEFRLECDGSTVKAMVPGVFLPEAGTTMWLTVPRTKSFVFGR